jgi:hypothetical protein
MLSKNDQTSVKRTIQLSIMTHNKTNLILETSSDGTVHFGSYSIFIESANAKVYKFLMPITLKLSKASA